MVRFWERIFIYFFQHDPFLIIGIFSYFKIGSFQLTIE